MFAIYDAGVRIVRLRLATTTKQKRIVQRQTDRERERGRHTDRLTDGKMRRVSLFRRSSIGDMWHVYPCGKKIHSLQSDRLVISGVTALHRIFGLIPWGHSSPLCHALSLLSSLSLSRTSMRRRRATVAACDSSDTW